ncbi:MAG: hypothetical protein M0Q92_03005 [Methanoregula sp.]|jgi:hypothetical protein|nr:hypothetical protein [Methanoregula sp.]
MKQTPLILLCLVLCICAVMPAQAFVAKSLTITLAPNGDAEIDMQYELTFVEQTAVFLRIADPAEELKSAFDSNSDKPVTVTKATSSSATVLVPSFATIYEGNGKNTIVTPTVSFEKAQAVMNNYWFAPLVNPDFSPAVTTVIFPDGFRSTFDNVLSIPPISRPVFH